MSATDYEEDGLEHPEPDNTLIRPSTRCGHRLDPDGPVYDNKKLADTSLVFLIIVGLPAHPRIAASLLSYLLWPRRNLAKDVIGTSCQHNMHRRANCLCARK